MKLSKKRSAKFFDKSTKMYFVDVSKQKGLTSLETIELAKRFKQGEVDLLPVIASGNLKLVISVAKRYLSCGLSPLDLIEDGNIGLLKAIKKFDPYLGYKFSTYATFWIKQSIIRGIAKYGRVVRLPLNQYELINKILKAKKLFILSHKRKPTEGELSLITSMCAKKIKKILEINQESINIESYYESDGSCETNSDDGPFENIVKQDQIILTMLAFNSLNKMEKYIIERRFELNNIDHKTLEDIGKKYKVTRERIRQVERKALSKMRLFILNRIKQKEFIL